MGWRFFFILAHKTQSERESEQAVAVHQVPKHRRKTERESDRWIEFRLKT